MVEAENRILEAEILALQKQKVLSLSPWGLALSFSMTSCGALRLLGFGCS